MVAGWDAMLRKEARRRPSTPRGASAVDPKALEYHAAA